MKLQSGDCRQREASASEQMAVGFEKIIENMLNTARKRRDVFADIFVIVMRVWTLK